MKEKQEVDARLQSVSALSPSVMTSRTVNALPVKIEEN